MLLFVGIFLFEQLSPTSNFGTELAIVLVHHRNVVQHLTNFNKQDRRGLQDKLWLCVYGTNRFGLFRLRCTFWGLVYGLKHVYVSTHI